MSRRKFFTIEDLSGDSKALFDVLNKESALAAVLIGTSFLDNCLASMIKKSFIKTSVATKLLDSSRGAIGTFSASRDLARCLGLISERIYQDLEIIGEIRNLFAHSHLSLDFDSENVASKCNSLMYAESVLKTMASHYVENDKNAVNTIDLISPRDRFNVTVALIAHRLLVDGLSIKEKVEN